MKKLTKSQVEKINKVDEFNATWEKQEEYIPVSYKGYELHSLVGDMPIIPRELGYDLPIKEIFLTGLEIMTAENEPNNFHLVYQTHFYSIVKPLSNEKVKVMIKYYEMPHYINSYKEADFLSEVKKIVSADPGLQIVAQPYGKERIDMRLISDGFSLRPNYGQSFYFETILYSDTYGELLLQIDDLIDKIEKQV